MEIEGTTRIIAFDVRWANLNKRIEFVSVFQWKFLEQVYHSLAIKNNILEKCLFILKEKMCGCFLAWQSEDRRD